MPLAADVLSEDLIRAAAASTPVTASSRTDDIPPSWDERAVLTTMLDYVRDTVQVKCALQRRAGPPGTAARLAAHYHLQPGQPPALAEYRASCGRLSELVAPLDLDTESRGTLSWRNEPVTLRWVLMHLIGRPPATTATSTCSERWPTPDRTMNQAAGFPCVTLTAGGRVASARRDHLADDGSRLGNGSARVLRHSAAGRTAPTAPISRPSRSGCSADGK